jgi:putative ABC transport system substrate-binding protein
MLTLLLPLLFAVLSAPLAAEAQPAGKTYRIGVLANALDTSDGPPFRGFIETLRSLGYVEARNVVIEWRSSEGDDSQLSELAASLVHSKVDVLFATSLRPARAALQATKTVPIVFVVAADPVGQGLVASLARPGGNATGLAVYRPQETSEKVVQLLKLAVPTLSLLGVLTNPDNRVQREILAQALPAAAQRAKVALLPLTVQSPPDISAAFDFTGRQAPGAVYVLGDVLTFIQRAQIVDLAVKNRLPALYAFRGGAEAGGLMSYGPDIRELFRRAAGYVDKILKGAKPGDMPVESSAKYNLLVNLKAAKAIGLTLPPALIRQADQMIE